MNKIQNFQKKLILKTEEIVAKELQISSKEEELLHIKQEIEKKPGIKEAKELSFLQQSIKSKTRKIKVKIIKRHQQQN